MSTALCGCQRSERPPAQSGESGGPDGTSLMPAPRRRGRGPAVQWPWPIQSTTHRPVLLIVLCFVPRFHLSVVDIDWFFKQRNLEKTASCTCTTYHLHPLDPRPPSSCARHQKVAMMPSAPPATNNGQQSQLEMKQQYIAPLYIYIIIHHRLTGEEDENPRSLRPFILLISSSSMRSSCCW